MRLTCPNCGAQYEVPDDVLPLAGRDVQCSNCGNTWFQAHPDNPDAAPEALEPQSARIRKPRRDEPADVQADVPVDVPVDVSGAPAQDAAGGSSGDDRHARRPLKDDVAGILREEARYEASQRAAERGGIESQPDLGLDEHMNDADRRAAQARARMARIRGEEQADHAANAPAQARNAERPDAREIEDAVSATIASAAADTGPSSRRELLPDIDDISSTLRSSKTPAMSGGTANADELPRKRRKSGFARGFSVSILVFAAIIALYIFAPRIGAMVPQLDPAMNAYIATVDQARLWLDTQIAAFVP